MTYNITVTNNYNGKDLKLFDTPVKVQEKDQVVSKSIDYKKYPLKLSSREEDMFKNILSVLKGNPTEVEGLIEANGMKFEDCPKIIKDVDLLWRKAVLEWKEEWILAAGKDYKLIENHENSLKEKYFFQLWYLFIRNAIRGNPAPRECCENRVIWITQTNGFKNKFLKDIKKMLVGAAHPLAVQIESSKSQETQLATPLNNLKKINEFYKKIFEEDIFVKIKENNVSVKNLIEENNRLFIEKEEQMEN